VSVPSRRFGVSTHLYHGHRLTADHVREIAGAGFERLELRATRSHFDYHNDACIADLQGWLGESGMTLSSVHAPLGEEFSAGRWGRPWSLAAADADERAHAAAEAGRAIHLARRMPFGVFVVHLGVPRWSATAAVENSRDAARRSIEELSAIAAPLGVRIAVELIQNELSRDGSLAHFVESVVEDADAGVCLDVGHAHLDGDVIDAIETLAEHLIAVDLHDNQGRADDHLVPFEGAIDWAGTVTAIQKVGYEGTLTLELAPRGGVKDTLARARKARERLERLMAT